MREGADEEQGCTQTVETCVMLFRGDYGEKSLDLRGEEGEPEDKGDIH